MKDLQKEERLIELLSDREIYGLTETNKNELKDLLEIFPEWDTDQTLALTAAAISLSSVQTIDEMPADLKSKILAESNNFFSSGEAKIEVSEPRTQFAQNPEVESVGFFQKFFNSPFGKFGGWTIAAAACVALAFVLLSRNAAPVETVQNPPAQPTPTVQPTLAEQREQLIFSATDEIQTNLSDFNPKQPKNITGDVVWSNAKQKGFIRFHGLPVNDKAKETYQLWVFDASQSAKTPIDGGVFDVDTNGDVIVPINAKIKVQKPTMFAVTVEKPGGVVVSDLSKVMTVAKV